MRGTFEYKVLEVAGLEELQAESNVLGADGWELVSLIVAPGSVVATFKRSLSLGEGAQQQDE